MASVEVDVDVKGLHKLEHDLKAIADEAEEPVRNYLGNVADRLASSAAAKAPRRSGRLASSIRGRQSARKISITSNVVYANLLHWGGRHSPRPGIQTPIQYRRDLFAWETARNNLDLIAEECGNGVMRSAHRHGFNGR